MDLYRSMLFIPGQKERWIAKAGALGADAIILDLEDAVPDDLKAAVRAGIAASIKTVAATGTPCFARVNALDSGLCFQDFDAATTDGLSGFVLSKVETPEDIVVIDRYLSDLERRRGLPDRKIELVIVAETAMAMHRAYDLCVASPRVGNIMGGTIRGGDIARALGFVWTRGGLETLYLRSKILMEARAAGIQYPLSGIWGDIEDLDGLRAHATLDRQLGFRGEFAIHPSHVPVLNEVYSPSAEEIEYSRGVLEAMAAGERAGTAGVRYRGELIDYAHVRTARETLACIERFQARARPAGRA